MLTYKVESYAFGKRGPSSDIISLMTQLTYTRLDMLIKVADYWQGTYDHVIVEILPIN